MSKIIDRVFSLVWDIAWYIRDLVFKIEDIPLIGDWLSQWVEPILFAVHKALWHLCSPIAAFGDLMYEIEQKIAAVVTLDAVWNHFKDYFKWAQFAWSWILDAATNIPNIVNDWWMLYNNPIRLAIAAATEGLTAMIAAWSNFWNITWPGWTTKFDTFKADWDTFWTVTYPTLVDVQWAWNWWKGRLTEVSTLIDSTLRKWFPEYDKEAEQQPDRISFFTNPLDWLLDKFTDWFLGPEV